MAEPLPDDRLLYSLADSARMLGVGLTMLFKLIKEGELQTVSIGRRRLIARSTLVEFVDDRKRYS